MVNIFNLFKVNKDCHYEFKQFSKIPRYYRDVVITEKIDGTNAQILITDNNKIFTGSRNRWITPGKKTDNHGFAQWVKDNEYELLKLGPGRHFGEWFGKGIQRGYALEERRFYLFNTEYWKEERLLNLPICVGVVPILYEGLMTSSCVEENLKTLRVKGSVAVPGYMKPEGIVIYHKSSGQRFKITLENDQEHKGHR